MSVPRTLDFRDHRRELGSNTYVYAVVSRRARGLSIGVNLNPDKVCNFDCPYCQVDRTTPGAASEVRVDRLAEELESLLDRVQEGWLWSGPPFDSVAPGLRRVADVAFAGDGEPTTPPEFPEAAQVVRAIALRRGLGVPLRLLTNATLFDRPRVRSTLSLFDELWCKLDAGTEGYFHLVDGTRFSFRKVLDNLLRVARERPLVIQSLFLAWEDEGPTDTEVAAYWTRLRELGEAGGRIDRVQIYTVARRPADPRVGALPAARLEEIASGVGRLGLAVEVFGADG